MRRLLSPVLAALLAMAWSAAAANVRLYLSDGSYHVVREYKVEQDRVRYYSVERSEWEEIPLSLVDLKRTQGEIASREESRRAEAAMIDAEEKAERELRREVDRVPEDNGVYLLDGEEIKPIPQAESKVVTDKKRSVLKVLSPIPIVAGKATVELDGERSATVVTRDRPEFYIRLEYNERFGIVKLAPKKGARVVQRWSIVPVTKEIVDEADAVEVFRRQLEEGLYKIWPVEALEPGEYAVVEYTEGKGNIQVWDFAYRPGAKP